jgi:hypothetical protein
MQEVSLVDRMIERANREGCVNQEEYDAWQKVKTVLAQQSTNTGSPKLPSFIELCESVEASHIGTLSDRERLVVNRVRDIIGRKQHNT